MSQSWRLCALITDPMKAAEQAVTLARRSDIQTICTHGDTPAAEWIVASVRAWSRRGF